MRAQKILQWPLVLLEEYSLRQISTEFEKIEEKDSGLDSEIIISETCMALMRLGGPIDRPIFQPVADQVFPAEPIVIVLSYIPGKFAILMCSSGL